MQLPGAQPARADPPARALLRCVLVPSASLTSGLRSGCGFGHGFKDAACWPWGQEDQPSQWLWTT